MTRANGDRIVVEDRRLDEARLDVRRYGLVDELRPGLVLRDVDAARLQPLLEVGVVLRPEIELLQLVDQLDALPRRLQVDLLALEGDLRRPERLPRDEVDEVLDPSHRVPVVGVRLVPLEHRELGVALEVDALVAKVLADLVHALEAADDQPLEVELGRDAEVEVLVEHVVMRHERLGERAAVARLQHGRLHLDEALAVEEAPDRGDDARAQHEVGTHLLVHQ